MDREANLTEYSSVRAGGETAAVTGEGIRVGELVMLRQDDEVPCDMVQPFPGPAPERRRADKASSLALT